MSEERVNLQPGSFLSDLLGAFLIDLAQAQNMSNRFSAELSVLYERDPLLRVFPVPNGYITDVEVALKIAVEGLGIQQSSPELLLRHVSDVFSEHVAALAAEVGGKVARGLQQHREAFTDEEQVARMAKALTEDPLLARLSSEVDERVQTRIAELVTPEGEVRWQAVLELMRSAFNEVFVDHPDYGPLPQAARENLKTEIEQVIESRMTGLRQRLEDRPSHRRPVVRVVSSGEVLSTMPEGVFGEIKLKAGVRDFVVRAWTPPGPGGTGDWNTTRFQIVPAKH